MIIDNKEITIMGKLIKTARIVGEWYEDVEDPEKFIEVLKENNIKADIFSFWQRFPKITPRYDFYMEWDPISAIPIKSYDYWFRNQIKKKQRQAIKKAERKGVIVKKVEFNDSLVEGIKSIYDETPIRQGKLFPHYGKDFDTIKKEHMTYLDRSDFIGAYFNDELIGFIKLTYMEHYADPMQIISKIEHRDKAPINALIAKAVELCEKKGMPYFCYGGWDERGLGSFKHRNGFEKFEIPRYYVPLSIKGYILISLRLHHGLKSILPEKIIAWLIDKRRKYYLKRYSNANP